MANEIRIFDNPEFGQIRTLMIDSEPWFVGKDIAAVLGYERETKSIVDHVDDDDRIMVDGKTQSQFGIELGQRGGWIINESGLYGLIFASKLPAAKQFKRWVTKEVLPSIRKTGQYHLPADKSASDIEQASAKLLAATRGIMSLAEALSDLGGYKKPMAMSFALSMISKTCDVDASIFEPMIPAENNPGILTATDIAKALGLTCKTNDNPSPQRANALLAAAGLQEISASAKNKWQLTDLGKQYGENIPVSPVRTGYHGSQIKWSSKTLDCLKDFIAKRPNWEAKKEGDAV